MTTDSPTGTPTARTRRPHRRHPVRDRRGTPSAPPSGSGREVQAAIYRRGVFGHRPVVPVEPDALEARARRRMSPQAWSYVDGGAGQQRTARANLEAFGRHRIVPRMLVDVEQRDTSVELFGRRLPAPLLFAPIGVLEMAHRDAEHAVAAGRARAGAADGDLDPGLGADGGDRRRPRGLAALVPALLEQGRRARRLVRRPRRGERQRGDRGHPRHARARLAHPRPRPRLPAVRPRRGHRAVHQRPALPGARRGARRRGAGDRPRGGAVAAADPGRGPRAGLDGPALPRRRCATTCARRCRGPRSRPSSTCSPARR